MFLLLLLHAPVCGSHWCRVKEKVACALPRKSFNLVVFFKARLAFRELMFTEAVLPVISRKLILHGYHLLTVYTVRPTTDFRITVVFAPSRRTCPAEIRFWRSQIVNSARNYLFQSSCSTCSVPERQGSGKAPGSLNGRLDFRLWLTEIKRK